MKVLYGFWEVLNAAPLTSLLVAAAIVFFAVVFAQPERQMDYRTGTIVSIERWQKTGSSVGGFSYQGTGMVSGGSYQTPRAELVIQLDGGDRVGMICEEHEYGRTEYARCLPLQPGDKVSVYLFRDSGWKLKEQP